MPDDRHIVISDPQRDRKSFEFDRAYWTHDKSQKFTGQEEMMEDLGKTVYTAGKNLNTDAQHVYEGFKRDNVCIRADWKWKELVRDWWW